MPKILIYSQFDDDKEFLLQPLIDTGYDVKFTFDNNEFFEIASEFLPDIVIFSTGISNSEISKICRKTRLLDERMSDVQIILITENSVAQSDLSKDADAYITSPVNTAILLATIKSHLKIKNALDIFSENNNKLAKRFYQLGVLYDTSSKLAGTLNSRKLLDLLSEGLEQSISYSICLTLIINSSSDIVLLINSLYPISKNLEKLLKTRVVNSYKMLFEGGKAPFTFTENDIKTEIIYKKDDEIFDEDVLKFFDIFSPIATSDKFFGTIEILRDIELSKEDAACFQTLVSQVVLPLESAILYNEIQEKNEKLVKLERIKSEFVSIVSHELRTPLTAIKNAIDIMLCGKTGQLNEQMEKFLNMGKKNVSRLATIINDLLDLSKIEAGKMQYRMDKMDLIEPINLIFTTFLAMATEKNISFKLDIIPDSAIVYADMQKIEQVLSNLVSNALKFTEANGEVVIALKEDNANYIVSVSDSGIGISRENINKVFDKFLQIENSLSRKTGGTGLGLPIAKELILSQNGQIYVESEEGKGTTFSFSLPKFKTNI